MESVKVTKETGKFMYLPLIVLMLTQIGTSGDNAILSVATNSLITALHANMSDIQLANMVYSLCAGAFMVAGGMLGIIIGWKKNFRIGIILAVIGEVLLSLSANMMMFTWGGRLLVGLGASFMIPSVLGLIPGIYKGKERVFAFGAIGAATGIAAAAGPIIAGLLIDNLGFRVAFGALALYFAVIFIGSFFMPDVARSEKRLKLDVAGIIVAAVGLFLFLIGISKISVWGLIKPLNAPFTLFGISPALPLSVVGIIVLIILVAMEKRIEAKNGCALIPASFLKTPQVRAGLLASATVFLFLGGIVMLINPYLQLVGGFSAVQTGIAMISFGLPMFLASMGIPKYFSSVHPRTILIIGYIVLAVSVIPMACSLKADGVNAWMYVGMILSGFGQGFLSAQASNVVALAVNERDAQQSGGIQAAARNVGQAIGVAILGMVMLFTINSNLDHQMVKDVLISPEARTQQEANHVTFMGDAAFTKILDSMDMTGEEKDELVRINANAREDSTKTAFYILGVLSILGILTTPGVKITKKKQ